MTPQEWLWDFGLKSGVTVYEGMDPDAEWSWDYDRTNVAGGYSARPQVIYVDRPVIVKPVPMSQGMTRGRWWQVRGPFPPYRLQIEG